MLSYKNVRVVEVGKLGPKNRKTKVTATCYCGNEFDVILSDLKNGNHKSCGCLHGERHGMKGTRPYTIWLNMRDRCNRPKSTIFKHYGARGIKVCDSWQNSFINFWKDMEFGYSENLSIDRINNNKGYSPENCKWSTRKEQNRNQRTNVTHKKECAVEASERLGGHKNLVADRLHKGWSKERAFTTPVRKDIK